MAKALKIEGRNGPIVTSGATSPPSKKNGPATIDSKNKEIKKETAFGKAQARALASKSWRGKQDGRQFISGQDTGKLSWLTPLLCAFFGLVDVGHKKNLRVWNFPPSIDNIKKKHQVMFQYFYQIDGKYLCVDAFDDKTSQKKIDLIKAWMEALGYRYTYIMGGDMERLDGDNEKFANLIFKTRLAVIDPKSKNYPKFKVPQTYAEAGLPYGQSMLQKAFG